MTPPARRFGPVLSWALYDFADTIFSMNVVSRFLPLWLTRGLHAPDWAFPFALAASMILVAAFSTGLGAASDRRGRRKPFLSVFCAACALFTFLMGGGGGAPAAVLSLFVAANFAYQLGGVFYNALLPVVSRGFSAAHVSGFGTALGYVGSIAGLVLTWPFVSPSVLERLPSSAQSLVRAVSLVPVEAGADESALYANVFVPTAALYLLFALPCLLFVHDDAPPENRKNGPPLLWELRAAPAKLWDTLRGLRTHRPLMLFMLANFFILDAAHTVIAFMSVYAAEAMGMASGAINSFLIVSTVFAMLGSFAYGWLASRFSPRAGMHACFLNWFAAIGLALFSPSLAAFKFVGPLAGMALGGLWTCARLCLLELVEPGGEGRYFGLYTLTGKCAAVAGPMLWGVAVFLLADFGLLRYRAVLAVLLALLALGWRFFQRIPASEFVVRSGALKPH